jgi:hypothetical protein
MSKKSHHKKSFVSANNISDKKVERRINWIMAVCTVALVVVGILQLLTYRKQADISENSNKLAMYKYRYDFYEKVSKIQKTVSVIELNPEIEMEKHVDLSFEILSAMRESKILFDEKLANRINEILELHLDFLNNKMNDGMSTEDYRNYMLNLNKRYGEFLQSKEFLEYLDINLIKN